MPGSEIEEVKSKIDLAEFIGEYIKLTPTGAGFKALCPFHNEKTPSFMVSPAKQIWRCFGCGEGGDIFAFLMKTEGLEFGEALRTLAQKAGVQLKRTAPELTSQKNRLIDLAELASRYWHKILLESSQAEGARTYLAQRGLSEETIEDFKLGFTVDSWDDLMKFLTKKGFSENEIFLAGLSVKKDRGVGFYDRFRGRLMFPIKDLHGQVAGFGGRALKDEASAKYINTPQTIIYNKSLILYGLNQAKEAIKKENLCVIVEGYMDVLPSHQMGVKNVVAISGTALTADQVRLIKRYTNNLALALDMDLAGRQAAERSIEVALMAELNVKVISLPQGKDPGECIKNNSSQWPAAIRNAQSVMEYFFSRAVENRDISRPEDKKLITKLLLEKIVKIGNKVEQDYWLKKLAQKLSVSESILRELVMKQEKKSHFYPLTSPEVELEKKNKPMTLAKDWLLFQRILALILAHPQFLPEFIDDFSDDFLLADSARELYKNLVLFYTKNIGLFEKVSVDKSDFKLFDQFESWCQEHQIGLEAANLLADSFLLLQKEFANLGGKEARLEIDSLKKILKLDYFNNKINVLKEQLALAEEGSASENAEKIYLELNELIKQKGNINQS